MCTRPHLLDAISGDLVLDVVRELGLVSLRILSLEVFHVLGDVTTENILSQDLRIKLPGVSVVSSETFRLVRNFKSTVNCSLQHGEDFSSGGSTRKTNVEKNQERSSLSFDFLDEVVSSVSL